jgi:hypothetical protein
MIKVKGRVFSLCGQLVSSKPIRKHLDFFYPCVNRNKFLYLAIFWSVMKKTIPFLIFAVCLMFSHWASGQSGTPTFSETIAPILYKNCTVCHRTGGIGPFEIESYADAQNNGLAIRTAVQSGYMPPWPPDTTYSRFSHQRVLGQQQIADIVAWVDGGMPQGNPSLEPPLPVFSGNSELSQPASARYRMPAYTVTSDEDDYRAFVIPNLSPSTQAVTEIQFYPGNKQIVHHILLYYDTTGICQQLDNADPLPGYSAFGGIGTQQPKQMGAWVPGSPALLLPSNFGMPAYQGGKFVMQVHYAPGSAGLVDTTAFELVYKPITSSMREVFQIPILNHFTSLANGPLTLLPNQKKVFVESQILPIPISVLGVTPHMHLIGRNKKVYALKPLSTDTVRIVRIPDWNFNWQGQYMYPRPLVLPAGTTLRSESLYDNTSQNPFNPSNPPQAVFAGESTLDEMMMTYFMFVPYQSGDENLVLDSGVVTSVAPVFRNKDEIGWTLCPNPSLGDFFLVPGIKASLEPAFYEVVDARGKKVFSGKLEGGSPVWGVAHRIPSQSWKAGLYQVRIIQKSGSATFSFLKN